METPQRNEPTRFVLGTAGHIDHGKTALVTALTGTDTDRLPEEKKRGITIELGFAALELEDGLAMSVVDVPGHERLVRTMVAGATGIDLVLLVVAADEGVMPQTREHVAICELLGIHQGVVALSKSDLVDADMRELAREEVGDLLAGTVLANSPVVCVSALQGEGLEELREALAAAVRDASARTDRRGPPRLGIDRVFAMRGFGTVVTGTLVGRALDVGQRVVVYPSGLEARIRGLQTHGHAVEHIDPGARCAVNLQGVETEEISRGEVLATPHALAPTTTLDVQITWLPTAPPSDERVSVEFLSGTAKRRARLACIGARAFVPGQTHLARIHIDADPVALLPGDRFVVRGFARTTGTGGTLGGGIVLDIAPPQRRRSDPALIRELTLLAQRDDRIGVRERVFRTGFEGVATADLRRETGLDENRLAEHLAQLETEGSLVSAATHWISTPAHEQLETLAREALDTFHHAEPLLPGMPRAALLGKLPSNATTEIGECVLDRLEAAGALQTQSDLVRRPDFVPHLDVQSREVVQRILHDAKAAGLEPPAPREWAERLGVAPEQLRDLLAHLEREGTLVRAPGNLWFHRQAVDDLQQRVVQHLDQHGEIDTPSYKKLIGTTRRTAVPLMELFDERQLTRRRGNVRVRFRSG